MAYHLAQINIAKFRKPVDDPVNADFVNALDGVNAQADASPGFVWRLQGAGANALEIRAFEDPNMLVNISVWESVEALGAFVYRQADHRAIMRRRQEWFDEVEFHLALWWIEAGQRPSVEAAIERLRVLQDNGPSPEAFTFKDAFPPPAG